MADLLQALAADVIAGAGISPSDPVSSHPDLLRRYNELGKIIQVWNTEGDKTAVRREVNLIKAQLSYSKDVISAQKTFATNNMKERNNALNALEKLEVALIASSAKLTAARNTQSEYIMQKVAAVASRPGSRGSGPRAWSAVNGILGEEGLIGRVPDPALPLLLARMKDTYGHSGLGDHAQHELEILTKRAHKASVAQKAALARNQRALQTVGSLTSRAEQAGDKSPELAQVIKEAQGFSSKVALFMEEEVGLKNKAELQARLENLQGQSDTLGRMEARHKQLDELLGRGGGSNSERQKIANMISHPRFRAWAESNGYEVNALGIADRTTDGSGAVLTSYVSGRDDLKAVLHFQHQLAHPESYRSIMNPFGQRSRSGKSVVVTDKVSLDNAKSLLHKSGKYQGRWVSLDDGSGTVRVLNERQYQEHAQKYVAPSVFLLTIVNDKYAQSGGVYYKLLPTGKWAQQAKPPEQGDLTARKGGSPLMYTPGNNASPTRFATIADLTESGGKPLAKPGTVAKPGTAGLISFNEKSMGKYVQLVVKKGGTLTEHQQPPKGMVTTYAGELMTQHAIDVRNSRDKGAVDVKVHGLNGIRTFSGDDPIIVDVLQTGDDTGFRDVVAAYFGARRAETARDLEGDAPTNVVTTQSGQQTWIDHSNETNTVFSDTKQRILGKARGDITEGPATREEQEQRRRDQEALGNIPEQVAPLQPKDPQLPGPPVTGGPPMPRQKYHVPVTLKTGETRIAGITADSPEDAARLVAKHYGDDLESAKDPVLQAGDMPGTYAAVGAARRVSVERRRDAQRTAREFGSQLDKHMPELDQLRAKYDRALLASTEKPTDKGLTKAARDAKLAYDKAAREQLQDRAERKRHARGESITKIQEAPLTPKPPPEVKPDPKPAPKPSQLGVEAFRQLSGTRRGDVIVEDVPMTEQELQEAKGKEPRHGDTQEKPDPKPEAKPAPKPEGIGAKLRGFLGLGPKGKRPRPSPVQEREDAPQALDVPGGRGLPDKPPARIKGKGDGDDNDNDDDEGGG